MADDHALGARRESRRRDDAARDSWSEVGRGGGALSFARMDAHVHAEEEEGVLVAPPALVEDDMVGGPETPAAPPAKLVNGTSLN